MNRGKSIILLMFVAAVLAAVGAIWYQYHTTRRPLEFWGARTARIINLAPQVKLKKMSESGRGLAGAESEIANGANYRDISQARGLVHFRRSLIEHDSFLWDDESLPTPRWQYMVEFSGNQGQALVLVDLENRLIGQFGTQKVCRLAQFTADGLGVFFAEQFASPPGDANNPAPVAPPATSERPATGEKTGR
ncbi:MAG: hypothetical protein SGJ20_01420 [Planctomycetota bacterium]|nr:hypothetical protein [Planctomycetota bacterium]